VQPAAGKSRPASGQAAPETSRPAGPAATASRHEAAACGIPEKSKEAHAEARAATAPRPAAPADAAAAAASPAAAEPLAEAGKPVRHAAAGSKAEAAAHGAREAAPAAPVAAPPSGDASGERGDAAPGAPPQPYFAAAAEPARRADGAAAFAPIAETAPAPPDFAPLHEQVAMRLVTLPDGAHEVALQLSPENLGNLRIDLKLSGGRMDAVVRAENPEAREALLRDVPALREALASGGITLSSFDVSLSGGSYADQQAPRQAGGWEAGQGHRPRRDGEAESAAGAFRPGRAASQQEAAGAAGGHWIA
jgi:flagellar hook-length control protein FliK